MHRHTDIQTYRHTDIQTYRHTDIHTHRHIHTLTHTHTQTTHTTRTTRTHTHRHYLHTFHLITLRYIKLHLYVNSHFTFYMLHVRYFTDIRFFLDSVHEHLHWHIRIHDIFPKRVGKICVRLIGASDPKVALWRWVFLPCGSCATEWTAGFNLILFSAGVWRALYRSGRAKGRGGQGVRWSATVSCDLNLMI